jgi:ABC-2 type transport system permease protein
MRLLAVELNRFRSRRAIALLVIAAAVLAVVLAGVTAYKTRPLSEADRADAAAQAKLEGNTDEIQQQVRACQARPHDFLGPTATADECEDALVPGPEAYYPRKQLSLSEALAPNGLGLTMALVLVALMVIAGCTFAGSDWASGSVTNQLLFEPRRLRVWLAKAAAVTIGAGAVALVVLSGFWLALGLVARARGIDVPADDVSHVAWQVVRATALSMGAGLGAYALTMVFRHTVTTLALLFVYSIGGEIAVNLLPVDGTGRWAVGNNTIGWLATRYRYFDPSIGCTPGDSGCNPSQLMTHAESAAFLGALLVVALVVSVLWFRSRDV